MFKHMDTLLVRLILELAKRTYRSEQGKEPTPEQINVVINEAVEAVTKETR